MAGLFDGTKDIGDMGKIYDQMKVNCPRPSSKSKKLWKLRHATKISDSKEETMLEKAVANLARRDHMPDWFNQCPAASGIGGSSKNRRSSVDLVHWDESSRRARLVELKWKSDDPPCALRQVLRSSVTGCSGRFRQCHGGEMERAFAEVTT